MVCNNMQAGMLSGSAMRRAELCQGGRGIRISHHSSQAKRGVLLKKDQRRVQTKGCILSLLLLFAHSVA